MLRPEIIMPFAVDALDRVRVDIRTGAFFGRNHAVPDIPGALGAKSRHELVVRKAAIGRLRVERTTVRSEEHTSELPSLMRISYAVFCLKKKKYTMNY